MMSMCFGGELSARMSVSPLSCRTQTGSVGWHDFVEIPGHFLGTQDSYEVCYIKAQHISWPSYLVDLENIIPLSDILKKDFIIQRTGAAF